jgi:hypothetical protein
MSPKVRLMNPHSSVIRVDFYSSRAAVMDITFSAIEPLNDLL